MCIPNHVNNIRNNLPYLYKLDNVKGTCGMNDVQSSESEKEIFKNYGKNFGEDSKYIYDRSEKLLLWMNNYFNLGIPFEHIKNLSNCVDIHLSKNSILHNS